MKIQFAFAAIAAALALAPGAATAQFDDNTGDAAPFNRDEAREFLSFLHKNSAAEIEVGNWVQAQTDRAALNEFAETLVSDHESVAERTRETARDLNIPLADEGVQEAVDRRIGELEDKTGVDFARTFAESQIDAHRDAAQRIADAQQTFAGTPVGELAADLLPTYQAHERDAVEILAELESERR